MADKTKSKLVKELKEKIRLSEVAFESVKFAYDMIKIDHPYLPFDMIKQKLTEASDEAYKEAPEHKYREFYHTKLLVEIKWLKE